MTSADATLPADLLAAVASRTGRVVLVLGAGSSLEFPTDLELSATYSIAAHTALIRDGLLDSGDCEDPADLSVLASTVHSKLEAQREVVKRLPLTAFRQAEANSGHRAAAALLREGAVSSVMTLNFDLAMSDALRWAQPTDVTEIPGPGAMEHLGAKSVIYLHRNVQELDYEKWILRTEALDEEWQDQWEEVVAMRIIASPIVVFAGLGSPAAVLTKTAARITKATSDVAAYVVDPVESPVFADQLGLEPQAHIQTGWCAFMDALGARVHAEICDSVVEACRGLCQQNGWTEEESGIPKIREHVEALGLLDAGSLRARWLGDKGEYSPDDERRVLLADLLLGIGILERTSGATARLCSDGIVDFVTDSGEETRVLVLSGLGAARWAAMDARVSTTVEGLKAERSPRAVLVGGVIGSSPAEIAPPSDLVVGDASNSILSAHDEPITIHVDELRADPSLSTRLVA